MKIIHTAILFMIMIGCQTQDMKHVTLKRSDFETTIGGKQTDLYLSQE